MSPTVSKGPGTAGDGNEGLSLSINLSGIRAEDLASPRYQLKPKVPGSRRDPKDPRPPTLSYSRHQKAFEDFPVDDKKVSARKEVQAKSAGNILGRQKKEWDNSVTPRNHPVTDRQMTHTLSRGQTFVPKHNFRAEVLPTPAFTTAPAVDTRIRGSRADDQLATSHGTKLVTARTMNDSIVHAQVETSLRHATIAEMEVHPNLADKPAWNTTTQFDETQHKERELQLTARGNANRRKKHIKNYKTPVQREEDRKAALRHKRKMEAEHGVGYEERWQKEREEWEEVKRKVAEAQARQGRNAVVKATYHPGAWEYNKFQGRHAWSCCMCERQDGDGCEKVRKNPNAWNFASVL